jgi:hypothetical protein
MGLLDDAIRDHLELKRRRGADAGEVARAQREALDPVFPGGAMPAGTDPQAGSQVAAADSPAADGVTAPAGEDSPARPASEPPAADTPPGAEPSTVAQETVELDMESVLEEDRDPPGQDSLEWEVPGGAAGDSRGFTAGSHPDEREMSELPGDVPGQERMPLE